MKKEKFEDMSFLNLGKSMADFLKKEGYEIKLSFNGGNLPDKLNGYFPDIIAEKDGESIVVEVVTKKYLEDPKNLEEVKVLSKHVASQPDEKVKFYLILPKIELEEIKKIIVRNNIYVNSFYFLNI